MIPYDERSWAGISLICQLSGSIYGRCLPHMAISSCIVLGLKAMAAYTDIDYFETIFEHTYVYQIYTFGLGFVLVFRSSLAYSRFWEGRTEIESMSSKFINAAVLCLVFDHKDNPTVTPSRHQWRWQLLSLASLIHGMALLTLGGVDSVEVLAGADPNQCLKAVKQDMMNDKVNMAFTWIQDAIIKRHKNGGLNTPPPIITRIFQELSTAMLGFNNALKIHNTPFPFPYVQIVATCLLIFTITIGFVMHVYVESVFWATFLTLVCVGGYHAINEVAIELEDPFGNDANDLPMSLYHKQFNERLVTMSYMDSAPFKLPDPDYNLISNLPPTLLTEPPEGTPNVESGFSDYSVDGQTVNVRLISHLSLPGADNASEDTTEFAVHNPELAHRLKSRRASIANRRQTRRMSAHLGHPP